MRVIDFHTHVFRDDMAPSVVPELARRGGIPAFSDGTVSGLIAAMDRSGVGVSVVQPVATKPSQVSSINDWVATIPEMPGAAGRIVLFGAMHPDFEDPASEIERIVGLGMQGLKLHPEHQDFSPDDPKMAPIYEAAIAHDLPILFHAGADVLHTTVTGTPTAFARMLERWPEMKAVLAHMGGFRVWNDVARQLVGRDVFIDTAYSLGHMSDDEFVELVRSHGSERVIFGSDAPWTDSAEELAWLRRIGLSERELDDILGDNATRLLGMIPIQSK